MTSGLQLTEYYLVREMKKSRILMRDVLCLKKNAEPKKRTLDNRAFYLTGRYYEKKSKKNRKSHRAT